MGIMDTLASVSTPETESGGIAASMANNAMEYHLPECLEDFWAHLALERWGCLSVQIVNSFEALLLAEKERDCELGSDLLFSVIVRQAAPSQDGASVRKWSRGYPQGDGRWVKLSDGSAIHWQFSHDAQQPSRQSAVMSAFLWHRDVQDANNQPLAVMRMPGVGLLAIEQVIAQAVADLNQ